MGICYCDKNIATPENYIQNEMPSFEKLMNKVCKIKCTNGKKGIGFFYKIPVKNYENKFMPVLINDSQTLNEKDFDSNKNNTITISINGKEIIIDESRKIYTNKEFEVTITEIKEDEIGDDNIYSEIDNINSHINDKPERFLAIYSYDYDYNNNNNDNKIFNFTFCQLKDINKKNNNIIEYENENKEKEFPLGSLLTNLKGNIIGIHKQKDKDKNFGILIKNVIKEYINNFDELFETNINNDS